MFSKLAFFAALSLLLTFVKAAPVKDLHLADINADIPISDLLFQGDIPISDEALTELTAGLGPLSLLSEPTEHKSGDTISDPNLSHDPPAADHTTSTSKQERQLCLVLVGGSCLDSHHTESDIHSSITSHHGEHE
ncbi:hypothetical protein BJ165DRAFT_1595338 [Panaeolus papilionaceus]|nr:hypothetical protein BJ165DRAFT_1595338 [Panaeolus papilionaceus]